MKTAWTLILTLLVGLPALAESGPGNGTDYVKVLFAQARQELITELADVHSDQVRAMNLDADVKNWLVAVATNGSATPHIEAVKAYLQILDMRFQSDSCLDSEGRGSTICFGYDQGKPVVLVALEQNRLTTLDQAMAMLVHECGHFTGEMNHLFLDRVGVELVSQLVPHVLSVSRSSKEISGNIFEAKARCEDGSSAQARQLLQAATQDLEANCAARRLRCDLSRATASYTGEQEWIAGQGFTMNVICILWLQEIF